MKTAFLENRERENLKYKKSKRQFFQISFSRPIFALFLSFYLFLSYLVSVDERDKLWNQFLRILMRTKSIISTSNNYGHSKGMKIRPRKHLSGCFAVFNEENKQIEETNKLKFRKKLEKNQT